MRTLTTTLLVALLLCALHTHAQPQWRFHVAFENSAGARDTIWFIYDTTATFGIDTHLGEGPLAMDPDVFNVWTYNADGDSTKTHALPYEAFPNGSVYMYQQLNSPVLTSVHWDTALFHAPYLPSTPTRYIRYAFLCTDYFTVSGMQTEPGTDCYNMFQSEGIVIDPTWADSFFGPVMIFSYDHPFTVGLEEHSLRSFTIHPNPTTGLLHVELNDLRPRELWVSDALGRVVLRQAMPGTAHGPLPLDINALSPGTYLVTVLDADGMRHTQRVVRE